MLGDLPSGRQPWRQAFDRRPRLDAEVNLAGIVSVLEAVRADAIDKVAFSSSAGILGELKTLQIAEDDPYDPDSPWGVSKLAAGKVALVYDKLGGMHNMCLRYFNAYGLHQRYDAYGNAIPIFAERALSGRAPFSSSATPTAGSRQYWRDGAGSPSFTWRPAIAATTTACPRKSIAE